MDAEYHSLPSSSTHLRFAKWDGNKFIDEVFIDINNPVLPQQFQAIQPKQRCGLTQPQFVMDGGTSPKRRCGLTQPRFDANGETSPKRSKSH